MNSTIYEFEHEITRTKYIHVDCDSIDNTCG